MAFQAPSLWPSLYRYLGSETVDKNVPLSETLPLNK